MIHIQTPLLNEVAAISDSGGGNAPQVDLGADDFAAELSKGIEAHNAQKNQPEVSQVVEPAKKAEPVKEEAKTAKAKLTDKLANLEEPAEEEAQTEEPDLPPEGEQNPKAMSKWKQLRAIEKQWKEAEPKIKEYEAKIAELQKASVPPELETELKELREFRDVYDLRNSPEFKKTVSEPLDRIGSEVGEIATEFKIDPSALLEAMREKSEWRRNIAIDKVVKIAADVALEEDREVPAGVANSLHNAANRMHAVWQKQAELETNANNLRQSKELSQKQKAEVSTVEQEKAWKQASEQSRGIIESKLSPVLKGLNDAEKTEFMDAVNSASISDDPVERAFQAQAPHVAAVLINRLNTVMKELAAVKKERDGIVAAKPGTKQNHGEPVKQAIGLEDDDFAAELQAGMRNMFA
jgi:hypothetical protein